LPLGAKRLVFGKPNAAAPVQYEWEDILEQQATDQNTPGCQVATPSKLQARPVQGWLGLGRLRMLGVSGPPVFGRSSHYRLLAWWIVWPLLGRGTVHRRSMPVGNEAHRHAARALPLGAKRLVFGKPNAAAPVQYEWEDILEQQATDQNTPGCHPDPSGRPGRCMPGGGTCRSGEHRQFHCSAGPRARGAVSLCECSDAVGFLTVESQVFEAIRWVHLAGRPALASRLAVHFDLNIPESATSSLPTERQLAKNCAPRLVLGGRGPAGRFGVRSEYS